MTDATPRNSRKILSILVATFVLLAIGAAVGLRQTGVRASDSVSGDRVIDGQPRTRLRYAAGPITGTTAEIIDLLKRGKISQASEKVEQWLSQNPEDLQALFYKGIVLTEQGNVAEAIAVFEALVRMNPKMPEPYNNLAVLYAATNQYNKARDALIQALDTDEAYSTAYRNLTDVYAIMAGRAYEKALDSWDQRELPETALTMLVQPPPMPVEPTAIAQATPDETVEAVPEVIAQNESAAPSESAKQSGTLAPPLQEQDQSAPVAVVASETEPPPTMTDKPVQSEDVQANTVSETVAAWASAWSGQDVAGYLSSYAPAFRLPDGMDRVSWEENRRVRIIGPEFINVVVENLRVEPGEAGTANAVFVQSYQSNSFRAKVRKTLVMGQFEGQWKILQEIVNQ